MSKKSLTIPVHKVPFYSVKILLLRCPKITLSRFRTVRKQSLFMDSKNYPLRCPKTCSSPFKTVRKTTPLWTPKTLFLYCSKTPVIGACLACARDTCTETI